MPKEFTENDVFKALGLGEQVQEPAAPAPGENIEPSEAPSGEQAQEPAAPAVESPDEPDPNGSEKPEGGEGKATPLTDEQRHKNAARRRQQELQEAVDNAVTAARQQEQEKYTAQLNEVFARAGLVDSATGKPITNLQEFEQWYTGFADARLQQDLKSGKLSKETLDQMISNHPAVKQAQQTAAQITAAQEQKQKTDMQARVQAELLEIQKLNPEIKTVDDLLNMPNAKEFYDAVKRGNSFLNAYKLANFDQIVSRQAEKAQQQAQALNRSKEHLVPTQSRGEGLLSVPGDELALYRKMMPNATDAEIQAHYNKYKKK